MNGKILIADDDRDLADVLAQRCAALGLVVRTAHTAADALMLVYEDDVDLVCLDINMPCGNGLSVCEMLATDDVRRTLPVIILTGQTDHTTVRRCHQLCAYYIPKCPDVWRRLEPLIRELLEEPAAT